jgi:hypothetical protein
LAAGSIAPIRLVWPGGVVAGRSIGPLVGSPAEAATGICRRPTERVATRAVVRARALRLAGRATA